MRTPARTARLNVLPASVETPVPSLPCPLLEPRRGYRFSPENLLLPELLPPLTAPRLADLGTGCGVLGLLAAHHYGANTRALLIERDPELGAFADENTRRLNHAWGETRAELLFTDLRTAELPQRLDLVLANPPFYAEGEGRPSRHPSSAGATHELHGTLADFLRTAAHLLSPMGQLLLLYPADRLAQVLDALLYHRLTPQRITLVHARHSGRPYRVWVQASRSPSVLRTCALSAWTER